MTWPCPSSHPSLLHPRTPAHCSQSALTSFPPQACAGLMSSVSRSPRAASSLPFRSMWSPQSGLPDHTLQSSPSSHLAPGPLIVGSACPFFLYSTYTHLEKYRLHCLFPPTSTKTLRKQGNGVFYSLGYH